MTFVVIGSGPAGVAATRALTDAGHHVTVLDAGDTIETGRMDPFDALAQHESDDWPAALTRGARGAFPVTVKDVPLKPAYGSLFPYALDDPDLPITRENAETLPSLALGGLSNSWGASMLPLRQQDMTNWPISLGDLAPHYEAVLRFVPIAAESDELSEMLPLYSDYPGKLQRSAQMETMIRHMRRHTPALREAGFTFGASRLAVVAADGRPNRCRYCGMCLYGCPFHSIYNASHTLDVLVRDHRVDYRPGVYIDRLVRQGDSIGIQLHERARAQTRSQLVASRVFVACGALSSTRLMLDSMGRTPSRRHLLDSQYFVIPMLTRRAAAVSVSTQGNTLAQIFLELQDQRVSTRTVHLQVYGYNDLMLSLLTARLPLSPDQLERVLRPLVGRLVVIQGYLHSDDSPGMTVGVRASGVTLTGDAQVVSATRVRGVVRRLAAKAWALGMLPLWGLAQPGAPGKGNHLGGSFPMQRAPGQLNTDVLGRLPGWDRVHLVDASVFPSVPATTITLTVMANAHRIASASRALTV